ncbi:hypothetical protein [Bacteroides congonensis]
MRTQTSTDCQIRPGQETAQANNPCKRTSVYVTDSELSSSL